MAGLEKNGRRPLQTDGFFTERSNSRVTTSGIREPEIFTMTASAKCSMLAATEVNPLPQILGNFPLVQRQGASKRDDGRLQKMEGGILGEELLNDEFYIGLRQKRATGKEYHELIEEFMSAVVQIYGEKVLIQFEDFANHNAFDLLEKYSKSHLVFNDDIQGTASVVLASLLASLKVVGGTLAEHTYLFLGAGEAGTGIAELIALQISKQVTGRAFNQVLG
nr:NADP-dependent malic enzyme, chloroplastic-like [Setaria viridis]